MQQVHAALPRSALPWTAAVEPLERKPLRMIQERGQPLIEDTRLAAPELLCREPCTFCQGLELGPDNLGMADAPAEPTVRPGDDVVATDQPGILDQPFCHQCGALDACAAAPAA